MRAVIVTQEEPFYLPIFFGRVLAEYRGVVAVVLLPGTPYGFTAFSYIKRLYDVFGLKDFIIYATLFIYYRILGFLSRWKKFGRFYSVSAAARGSSLPVYRLKNVNAPDSLSLLRNLETEVLVSVAAPQVFKKELINSARHAVNVHAALLPQYRGMMPSFWVLVKGEKKTGVTVHYLDEHIDTGSIIVQESLDISPDDTLHTLQTTVAGVGARALLTALGKIEADGGTGSMIQGKGSYYPFPTREAAREFRLRGRKFI